MPKQRPSPEKLLQQVQDEEREQRSGKLKIYLGAAPGVGKTYTMLQDAHSKRKTGLDVVVGVMKPMAAKKLKHLLKSFEILPTK